MTAVATEQVVMGWIAVDTGGGPSSEDLDQLVAAAAPLNSEGVPDLVARTAARRPRREPAAQAQPSGLSTGPDGAGRWSTSTCRC